MSFFPTADPEKLRAAMAQDPAFYHIAATHSPLQHSQNGDDGLGDRSAWSTPSQDPYSASQPFPWPSQGLALDSLPTPTQSMFDQAYSTSNSYNIPHSWVTCPSSTSSVSPFPTYTTHEAVPNSGYSFAPPSTTSTAWAPIQSSTSSFVPNSYDSPPSRSDYSTSSQRSLSESSPYAHSDDSFQLGSAPFIKTEDPTEHQRPRIYSVPGLISFTQPSHVNPGDVYSSPPLTTIEQQSTEALNVTGKAEFEDSKHFLRPQRPQTCRAISEDMATETRQKRGYTTQANSTCQCHQCGKLFQRSYNLKAHMETHDPHRDQPHACPYAGCKRRFVRRTDLMRHEQSVHLKERKYQCSLCYSSFARKDTLRRHMEDGCSQRPQVKKRAEKTQYNVDLFPMAVRHA